MSTAKHTMKYQRPAWTTLSITGLVALAVSLALNFSRPVDMMVDGQHVVSDVPPVTTTDRVFVPLRALDDALGADTRYDEKDGSIEVIRGDQTLRIKVGEAHATLNGSPMTLKHAPFRVRGRVMVSLVAVSRAFGVRTQYDRRSSRISVNSPGIIEAGAQQESP